MMRFRLVAACVCLVATAALAYVLPGSSVLRRMAEARDDLRLTTLRVDGTVAFFDQSQMAAADALGIPPSGAELRTDAVFSFHLPGRCRLDLMNQDQSRAAVVSVHGRTRVEGAQLPPARAALEEACALVALHSASGSQALEDLYRHLRGLGIETGQSSLGRFGGQVVYVLGRQTANAPQLQVYKDSFMPARIRFTRDGQTWEVRFLDYGGPITGEWFPRLVEVYRGDALELRFSSLKADSHANLSERLFSPAP